VARVMTRAYVASSVEVFRPAERAVHVAQNWLAS